MRRLAPLAGLLVAACAHHAAPPSKIVEVPVMRSCVPKDFPGPQSYADDDLRSVADPAERIKRIGAANLQRRARLELVEPVIAACR